VWSTPANCDILIYDIAPPLWEAFALDARDSRHQSNYRAQILLQLDLDQAAIVQAGIPGVSRSRHKFVTMLLQVDPACREAAIRVSHSLPSALYSVVRNEQVFRLCSLD
jgi:hypothetical protein